MTPRRIQMTRARPWRDRHPDAVIVDRRTKWGNPFKAFRSTVPSRRAGQDIAVVAFEDWLLTEDYGDEDLRRQRAAILSALPTLRGRDLACWCRLCDRHKDGLPLGDDCPDCEPCHADALLRAANEGD